eukprot:6558494-Lingulodinium_polyedra.AAC.1
MRAPLPRVFLPSYLTSIRDRFVNVVAAKTCQHERPSEGPDAICPLRLLSAILSRASAIGPS